QRLRGQRRDVRAGPGRGPHAAARGMRGRTYTIGVPLDNTPQPILGRSTGTAAAAEPGPVVTERVIVQVERNRQLSLSTLDKGALPGRFSTVR
ncbi:MAG: hypothetical protein M3422_27060, partial [Actinomycetota bacterium]|nr:hypothetical protein [Actinomycetota bacterium]